jgi:8-oxo-dGTP pyrophosphatase MutT (NUDIX family)
VPTLPGLTEVDTAKLVERAEAVMGVAVRLTLSAIAKHLTLTATPVFVASGTGGPVQLDGITADSAVGALSVMPVEWAVRVDEHIVPFTAKVFDSGAKQVIAGVTSAIDTLDEKSLPKIPTTATETYLAAARNRFRRLSDVMWELVRDELIEGVAAGESTQQLALRVKTAAHLTDAQAMTVARTEVMAAMNGGQYAQMRHLAEWGELTVTKRWEATSDSKTRPSHQQAHGQERELDQAFQVGARTLRFPGAPEGHGEAVNCRCTVLYDVSDTSLEALSAAAVVDTNGQPTLNADDLAYAQAVVAAGKKWKASDHPRGSDGKFIKKGFLPGDLLDIIKEDFEPNLMDVTGLETSVDEIKQLSPEHWAKLTDAQKQKLATVADDALNVGVPGSADAVMHLEDLDEGADELTIVDDDAPDVFQPSTELKSPAPGLTNLTNAEAQKLWDKGLITTDELDFVKKFNETKASPAQAPTTKVESPFKLNPDKGKSGDGYAAPGLWGKYGAAGLLIEAPGPNGEPVYLMVQRGPQVSSNKGKWQLPGGAIDEKETFEEGAARELFEEVGASEEFLASMSKIGSHDITKPTAPGKKDWTYSNIAAKAPTTFEPQIDGTETGDAAWLTKAQIIGMKENGLLHPALAKEIDKVFGVFETNKDSDETADDFEANELSDLSVDDQKILAQSKIPKSSMAEAAIAQQATFTPKQIKITHALSHKKHSAGTTIAVSKNNDQRVVWDGANYQIQYKHFGQEWKSSDTVKKSKLYDFLNTNYAGITWYEPGKLANDAPPIIPKASKPVGISYISGEQVAKSNAEANLSTGPSTSPSGTIEDLFANLDAYAPGEIIGTWQYKKDGVLKSSLQYRKSKDGTGIVVYEAMPGSHDNFVPMAKFQSLAHVEIAKKQKQIAPIHIPPPTGIKIKSPSGKKINDNAGLTELPGITKPLDLTGWKKVGGQQGSNQGGLFEAPDGQRYYVKKAKSAQHAANEVLANQLYAAAGVDVPEVRHGVNAPGVSGGVIVSKIVPNAKSDLASKLNDGSYMHKVQDGFAVDAWLANWDVVGLGYDNIVTADGKPWRIDAGGSLLYRAMGGAKGTKFGDEVTELDTLKNSSLNPQAAAVFGGMNKIQEVQSAKRLLPLTEDKIRQFVADAGMDKSLADRLIKRRKYILDKMGLTEQDNTPSPVTPSPSPVSTPTYSSEDVISNWSFANKYDVGDVVAYTHDGKYRVLKTTFAAGDDQVAYDVEQLSVSGQWQTIHGGIFPDQLQYEMDSYWFTETWVVPPPKSTSTSLSELTDINFNDGITGEQILALAPHIGAGKGIAIGKDKAVGNTYKAEATDDGKVKVFKGIGEVTSPQFKWESVGEIVENPKVLNIIEWQATGHAVLAKDQLGTSQATPTQSADWQLTSVSIWDNFKKYPSGTAFAEGTSTAGQKFMIVSGDEDGEKKLKILTDDPDPSMTGYPVTSIAILNAWINSSSMMEWHKPADPFPTPGTPGDVNQVPSPATGPAASDTTVVDIGDISHLATYEKLHFYDTFKSLNIAPSWSPKAIYEKLLQAQQKVAGSPNLANLTFAQALKVVDWGVPLAQKKKLGNSPYSDKVIPWLKTPAGMKVAETEHVNLAIQGKLVSVTPKPVTPASTLPKVQQTVQSKSAASSKPIPIPGMRALADNVLNGAGEPAGKLGTKAKRQLVYSYFKESPDGKYLKHDVEAIWKNLVKVQKKFPEFSMLDVIRIVDEGRANHTKSDNQQEFETKIKVWLGTQQGYLAATHEIPFDPETILKHNAPSASTIIPLGPQPDRTKAEVLAMESSAFKVISTSQAKSWYDKQTITGPQKTAQKKYTGSYYHTVNSALRLKTKASPAVLDDIKKMQDGMRPIDQDILVHRGTGFDQFGGVKSHEDLEKLVGHTVQDKAFMSTSVGGTAAFGGQVLLEIEVPRGTGVMFVKPFSHFASENEMLLSAGLRFRVLSVTKQGYKSVVRVRVIPPPDGTV